MQTGEETILHPDWPFVVVVNLAPNPLPFNYRGNEIVLNPGAFQRLLVDTPRARIAWHQLNATVVVAAFKTRATMRTALADEDFTN